MDLSGLWRPVHGDGTCSLGYPARNMGRKPRTSHQDTGSDDSGSGGRKRVLELISVNMYMYVEEMQVVQQRTKHKITHMQYM